MSAMNTKILLTSLLLALSSHAVSDDSLFPKDAPMGATPESKSVNSEPVLSPQGNDPSVVKLNQNAHSVATETSMGAGDQGVTTATETSMGVSEQGVTTPTQGPEYSQKIEDLKKVKSLGLLTPSEQAFLSNLSSLERDTILMKARVALMEQQAKYDEIQRKTLGSMIKVAPPVGQKAMDSASNPISSMYDKNVAPDERALAEMTLVSVYGTGTKHFEGELFYRGGRMKVSKGDKLPGDWVVSKIEPTRLIAKKGSRIFEIIIGSPETGTTSSINKIR